MSRLPRRLGVVLAVALIALAPAAGSATPIAGTFDEDVLRAGPDLQSPAPTGALGKGFVVAAANERLVVYDRAGAVAAGPLRLASLLDGFGSRDLRDPTVYHDPYDDIFVLTFLAFEDPGSRVEVVTIPGMTADQVGTWCRLDMAGDQTEGDGHQLADDPAIGFTRNRVTVATDNYGINDGNFDHAQVVSMRKSDLYDDPTCSKTVRIEVMSGEETRDPDGSRAHDLRPAQSIGGAPTDQFMVSVDADGQETVLVVWRVRVVDGEERLARAPIRVKAVERPPPGRQCGGTAGVSNTAWDTGRGTPGPAWYDADRNRLYAALAVRGDPDGGADESVIRWYEIRPRERLADSTVVRAGTIGVANHDLAWPAVATSGDGTVFLTYARAGLDECLSIWAASVATGVKTAESAPIAVGDARLSARAGPELWGDRAAIGRDPLDATRMALFGARPVTDPDGGPTAIVWIHGTFVTDA
jgi:hypothetical protein